MSPHAEGTLHVTSAGYLAVEIGGFLPLITPFTLKAHTDNAGNPTPEARANVTEIARRWNSQPDLLAACKDTLEFFRHPEDAKPKRAYDLLARLKAVIAQAEREV